MYKLVGMKVKRSIFNRLGSCISEPEVAFLLGARQVGKSTLMEYLQGVEPQGRTSLYFNLELPDDLLFFSRSEAEIFAELTQKKNSVVFIDEFHYLKNASKLFKAIYDSKNSCANKLSNELK